MQHSTTAVSKQPVGRTFLSAFRRSRKNLDRGQAFGLRQTGMSAPPKAILHCIATFFIAALVLSSVVACGKSGGDAASTDSHAGHDHGPGGDDHADGDHDHDEEQPPGIAIPRAVRENLGIRFAKVQRRAVSQTLRVPGQFELLPTAQRDYHAPVTGRIELLVDQYEQVSKGQLIATIDSPQWRELQAKLAGAEASVRIAASDVTMAEVSLQEQRQLVELLNQRVERLADASVRQVELENELAQAKLALPRLEAAVNAAEVRREEARSVLESQLALTASKIGEPTDRLLVSEAPDQPPRWRVIDRVPILAQRDGILDTLDVTDGRWVEAGDHLATTIDPTSLRFRAEALQGDLTSLAAGLPVTIVPQGTLTRNSEPVAAVLVLGPVAHAVDRTIALYATPDAAPPWARPGMAGYLEVTLNPDATQYLAIPADAVVRDGVELIFFRRLPDNPDYVERVVADTGETDGRWVEVYNNLAVGDEIVVDGVYQLLAATSTKQQAGGHFHNDGTFHEEDH